MKVKMIISRIILFLPIISFAADETFYTADPSKAKTGIIIVPISESNLSKEDLYFLEQQKTKGYADKESNEPKEMISSGKNYAEEINDNDDPTDTHLKSTLSKIKLAFKFKQIPFLTPIGFAVGGLYIKDSGWTAISTFFNDKNLGACKFKLNNMSLSHGAVQIPEETVRYDINKKVTNIFVEGSFHSGFIYNVYWNDSTFNYFLECANMKFDNKIKTRMVKLAKKIDKNIN